MSEKKVLVIGPMFIDIALNLKLPRMRGNTVPRPDTAVSPGGKGYNIAHTLNLLGIPTILSTMYGKDDVGEFIRHHLKSKNIETPDSNIVEADSGIFVAVLNEKGDTLFDKADTRIFQKQQFPKVDWSSIEIVIVLSSTCVKILNQLIKIKKRYPAIKFCIEMSGSKTAEHIAPYIPLFDLYISNCREAKSIGGVFGINGDMNTIINRLISKGIKLVIITSDKYSVLVGNYSGDTIVEYPLKKI